MKIFTSFSNKTNHKLLFQSNNSIETPTQSEQVDQEQQKESLDNFKTLGTIQSSVDQKKLLQDIEAKDIEPLPKETVDFVINFIKSHSKIIRRGYRMKFSHNGKEYKAGFIEENKWIARSLGGEKPYVYISDGLENRHIADINGKIIVPNNGRINALIRRGQKEGKTKKEVIEKYRKDNQKAINGAFINLANYY